MSGICGNPWTLILRDQPSMLRGVTIYLTTQCFPAKDPSDARQAAVDFCALLGPGVSIATSTVTPTGCTIANKAVLGSQVTFLVSGGVVGTPGSIVLVVTTSDGQTINRVVTLPILSLAGE